MGFGYEGKRIKLVPVDPDRHLENFYQWINDTDVTDTLGITGSPITRAMEKEVVEGFGKDPKHVIWALETLDGTHIGISGIHDIHSTNRVAITGSFIGPLEFRSKGYGTEASILRAKFAFKVLGLRMLKTTYLGGNTASQRMMEKTGYVEYGRIPGEHWKNGEYRDMVYMMLTKERFEELHG